MTRSLRLNHPNRPRAARGHPWAFGNELKDPPPADWDGETAELRSCEGRFLGMGIVNSRSQIAWRRYSRERVELDAGFLRAALSQAIGRRPAETARRLVWSESDSLPGLVADQFGPILVAQITSLALERRRALLGDLLQDLLQPEDIVWRNDAPIRRLEGLPLEVTTRSGRPVTPRWIRCGALEQWVDPMGGQKTGLYLDQRLEHARVAALASGRRVLDAFCHQGAFGLSAALAGAAEVLGVDQSPDAIESARRACAHHGLPEGRTHFLAANVFDWFPAQAAATRWDLIVLDPPPFARSLKSLPAALRGYKEIHLRALQHLAPGGILATYACSHHVGEEAFLGMVGEAAHDARRQLQLLSFAHQPPDHPVLPGMPESSYLRGIICQAD